MFQITISDITLWFQRKEKLFMVLSYTRRICQHKKFRPKEKEKGKIFTSVLFSTEICHVRSCDLTASGYILAAGVVDIVVFIN